MNDHSILTRELIERGGLDALVALDAPALKLLTTDQLAQSLQATLADKPSGDLWLFGYGSLIWNPTVDVVERRSAVVRGWHRSFCLTITAGRGSASNPGLVLGLDRCGDCAGVAFRMAPEKAGSELKVLWRREMLSGEYVPRWLEIFDEEGLSFGHALAFTIDPLCENYAGLLPKAEVVKRLATASGFLGTASEYLFRTCEGLRTHGIPDPELEAIATAVTDQQAASLELANLNDPTTRRLP